MKFSRSPRSLADGSQAQRLPAIMQQTQAEWLSVLMQGSFSEIYVIDCDSLNLIYLNAAARRSLQFPEHLLTRTNLSVIADSTLLNVCHRMQRPADGARDASTEAPAEAAADPASETDPRQTLTLETQFKRYDGRIYPVELRVLRSNLGPAPVFIIIGNDLSSQYESARALHLSEAGLRAIMANTPGLVYQFLRNADGDVSFPYLSDGCHALLGLEAHHLRADSAQFLQLILPQDRSSWLASMQASANEMKAWNWEGRIWIEAWKDIKWINLRGMPRALDGGSVQWEGIMTNITASKEKQTEIRDSRAQLAELSAHVDKVKEQERHRIAREIHDDLGGNLTAIKMALALLTRRLPEDNPALVERAAYLDALVDRTIESAHRISGDLRPGVLDFGIVAAIDWQAKEFQKQVGIPCAFRPDMRELKLDPDHAVALFRIFQEALTNISKHAQATRVRVRLHESAHQVQLEITDNGRGVAPTDRLKPNSFGIRGMVERANALGGTLTIAEARGGGSVVTIRIPLLAVIPDSPNDQS